MKAKQLAYLLPLVLFVVVAVYFAVGLGRDPSVIPSALIGKPVPQFSLPTLTGEPGGFSTADLSGNGTILVNVFASWCIPCRAEHPYLMRMAKKGVTIYGINYRDKPADARAWLAEMGNPYTRIGADRKGRVGIDWGVYGVPETFVVDTNGRIQFKQVGPITTADLAAVVRREIAKAGR